MVSSYTQAKIAKGLKYNVSTGGGTYPLIPTTNSLHYCYMLEVTNVG